MGASVSVLKLKCRVAKVAARCLWLGLIVIVASSVAVHADSREKPKLVLQITVDQLRGDLPMRLKERLTCSII